MYLSIVCENMNVFVCGHMHEGVANFGIKLALLFSLEHKNCKFV